MEICFQHVWGAVFDTDWTALDAAVTCQQLGFNDKGLRDSEIVSCILCVSLCPSPGAVPLMAAVDPNDAKPLPITYDFPNCDSTSYQSLLLCPRAPLLCPVNGNTSPPEQTAASGSGSGSGSESGNFPGTLTRESRIGRRAFNGVVGVRCEGMVSLCWGKKLFKIHFLLSDLALTGCADSDVRLVLKERTLAVGNLEICSGGRWTKVCSDMFDSRDLNVACRAMGFTMYEHTVANHRFLPPLTTSNQQILPFNHSLNCSGAELNFSQCNVVSSGNGNGNVCVDTRIQCLGMSTLTIAITMVMSIFPSSSTTDFVLFSISDHLANRTTGGGGATKGLIAVCD